MVDIVLKDIRGNDVEYPGVNTIKVNTVDGGVQNFGAFDPDSLTPEKLLAGETVGGVTGSLVVPDVLEDLPISLDFSGGDQEIVAPDGTVVKSAVIQKPNTLIPENIAEGVDVAGVIGTLAAGGGSGDWNCALTVVTSSGNSADGNVVAFTADELEQKGFVISRNTSTLNDLKTMIFCARVDTGASTSGTEKRLNFAYFQNWQLSNNGSSSYYNGIYDYQTSTTAVAVKEVYQSANQWIISGTSYPISLTKNTGLMLQAALFMQSSSYKQIGTYVVGIMQHKTARVCDTLT